MVGVDSVAGVLPAAVILAAAAAVAPAVEDSILVQEHSAPVVPLTSIAGEWASQVGGRVSQVAGRVSLRRVLDRCGFRLRIPLSRKDYQDWSRDNELSDSFSPANPTRSAACKQPSNSSS